MKDINKNPNIDEFLKSSIGERIAAVGEYSYEDQKSLARCYHRYDPDKKNYRRIRKKLMYLNHVFLADISRLDTENIEFLNKNVTRLLKYSIEVVDVLNVGRSIMVQHHRSDKITPRQQREIRNELLDVLKLPYVVQTRLDVGRVQVRRSELIFNIEKMLLKPERTEKYHSMMRHFTEMFPDTRMTKNNMTIKCIIEKN